METPPSAPPGPQPPPPPPRPPWWRRRGVVLPAAIVACLVAAVFFLGPPVAGAVAASQIRSALERELQSDVTVGDVSISWSGRIRLGDLAIRPRGAGFTGPLLEIPAVEASLSLRSALRGEVRAEVDVIRPVLRIERGEGGKFNYEFPEPPEDVRRRRRRRAGEPPPSVRATVRIREGEVRIRGDGSETVYSRLSLEAWIESPGQPLGFTLSAADPAGGRLSARGEYEVESGSGRLSVLAEDVALSALGGVLGAWASGVSLEGVARGACEYRWRGIPRFEGRGQLEVRDFALGRGGGRVRIERLVVLHEGALDAEGRGRQSVTLAAGAALVGSATADLGASPRAAVKVEFESDLSALSRALEGTWAAPALEGIARVRGSMGAGGDGSAKARWSAEVQGDGVAVGGARLGTVRLETAGAVEASGRPEGSASLRVGERIAARVEWAPDPEAGGGARRVSLEAGADAAELSRVFGAAAGLRPGVRLEGKATLRGRAALRESGESGGDLILAAEKLWAVDAGGRRREVEPSLSAKLTWGWDAASGRLRVPSLEVVTAWGRLEGSAEVSREGRWAPRRVFVKAAADLEQAGARLALVAAEPPALRGRLEAGVRFEEGRFRLDGTAGALVASRGGTPADASMALAGRLEFPEGGVRAGIESGTFAWSRPGGAVRGALSGRFSYARGRTEGLLGVRDLEIGDGRQVLAREPRVDLEHDATFGAGGAEIRKLGLVSRALRLEAAGRAGAAGWDLRARGRYLPEALGAALRPWWSGRLEGSEEREVEVRLEASAAQAGEGGLWGFLRRARGEARADLAPVTVTGITASGSVRAELRDGRVSVAAPLSVNGGTAHVSGTLDLRAKEAGPRSALAIRAQGVRANAEMGPLLEKISPIFHTANGTVEGKVEGEAALEWGVPAERGVRAALDALSGRAVFAARELWVTGSPAVVELLGALGEEGAVRGELLATDVRVGSGRCSYEAMTLRLARYALRFTGWVGFDGRMELLVEMPLTERFLQRYPRLGRLSGKTFFVTLEGTVARPRLDLDRAIQELLRRALEGAAQEKLEDAIRRLLERRGKDR
jgi:hypothetical protein